MIREELVRLFDEIGHAIAEAEAEHSYRGLYREADGIHFALAQVARIRARVLAQPTAEGGE